MRPDIRAGDRIRTDDVQLGKLKGEHSESAILGEKEGFSTAGDTEVSTEVPTGTQKALISVGGQACDLDRLMQVWPDLPDHIKQQIMTLVESVRSGADAGE